VQKSEQGTTPRADAVTLSVGIASFEPDDPAHQPTPNQLLTRADAALYQAKQQGRDRVALWSDELTRTPRRADQFRQTLPLGKDE
jgi:PleD family two-component response regulator